MSKPRLLFVIGVGSLLLAGCGGSALKDNGGSAAGGSGAPSAMGGSGGESDVPSGAGEAAVCPPGVPSAQQIASTPRANPNLELLALKLSTGIVADQVIYDRVVRDVTKIQMQDSTVAGIGYAAPDDGRLLGLSVDQKTLGQMQDGSYHTWNCLNRAYVTDNVSFLSGTLPYVTLAFKGIYDLQEVAAQYSTLSGIRRAEPGSGSGDGPTICLTKEGDVWHYVFDQASGDCPAGCTDHSYHHFTTAADGAVTSLGELSPELVATYASREACH